MAKLDKEIKDMTSEEITVALLNNLTSRGKLLESKVKDKHKDKIKDKVK